MPRTKHKSRDSEPRARSVGENRDDCAAFEFHGAVRGKPRNPGIYASVSAQQQQQFRELFYAQIGAVKQWFENAGWISPGAALLPLESSGTYRPNKVFHVFVSEAYDYSRALVPAWSAQRGRMEFPANRVAAGEAAVAHELVHVFFPNSNRMLAEGLAVYLHQRVAANAAFPNFRMDLHKLVAQLIENGSGPFNGAGDLDKINIASLDQVSTPDDLAFRFGQQNCDDSSVTYALAGSFIQYLIERCESAADRKSGKCPLFFKLYNETPLVPMVRDCGDLDRWRRIYRRPLEDVESGWKRLIGRQFSRKNSK